MGRQPDRTDDCPVEPAYLTKAELARRSGLSPGTIQRYKDKELIPFFQPGGKGGRLLFPPNALEAAVARAHQDESARTDRTGQDYQAIPTAGQRKLPGPRPRWRARQSEDRR
jgi:hypothetical protein